MIDGRVANRQFKIEVKNAVSLLCSGRTKITVVLFQILCINCIFKVISFYCYALFPLGNFVLVRVVVSEI